MDDGWGAGNNPPTARVGGLRHPRSEQALSMETGDQAKKLETAARTIAESRPRHRSVLLVESDPDLQWSLARMLTVNGNRVVGTSSGKGALAVIEQWGPELALVSSSLPGMTGVEVARELRARNPDLLVILMDEAGPEPRTSESSPAVAARLAKPFRFEALRALLESLQLTPAPAE
jgi:two-component system cell cycle sensor histidine kinase/response regulator CckA